MNAVEIEEAVSNLAEAPFDRSEFPYAFLQAFGNNDAAIRKLKSGDTNKSDLPGGVLQRNKNNIHLLACPPGEVASAMAALRASAATTRHKARFICATDGQTIQAERFEDGEPLACDFRDLPNRFAYFLSLAGISTVKRIDENAFDIRATGRLNKLYIELLKENPDWDTAARRQDLNHFFARLIFCFFAEDTNIFPETQLFTRTVEQMTVRDGSNTHEVLSKLFESMNTPREARAEARHLPATALKFPYVNGNLFSGSTDTPRFNQAARNYLLFVGNLDWKRINPDIFGSMIQAVADDEERGALGMHYTSVPNILKVLNPLFLDDLRAKLAEAGDSPLKLLNLRKRLARIRVFDPACGSGNFLVIAYKEMRQIEAEINERRCEKGRKSEIPISNFRGIELRSFPAEIARLALIIAEFQCDVLYRGELFACQDFLPLDAANWITCANALLIDWQTICPPTGKGVKLTGDDLFNTPMDQAEIDFENEGGETFICGNPPYKGSNWRTREQTEDLGRVLSSKTKSWKALDYVSAWVLKAAEYSTCSPSSSAFVTTNSICQGLQASILWPLIFACGQRIAFAHRSFKWSNLASHNAGVSVVVVGLATNFRGQPRLYEPEGDGTISLRSAAEINAYLLNGKNVFVDGAKSPIGFDARITDGSGALDGGHLILDAGDRRLLLDETSGCCSALVRTYLGSGEFIKGTLRWCLWIDDRSLERALSYPEIKRRVEAVRQFRANAGTRARTAVDRAHKFAWINKESGRQILIPTVFSERRNYITAGYVDDSVIINNAASIVQDADLHVFAVISSSLHIAWVRAIAGRLEDRLRYTSATCYNTFPIPTLTDENKADLTRCAADILLAREAHFPATIADMYDPERMDAEFPDLRAAHDRNDETLERIYIGRRFRNDTERLEKLFELYTQMTAKAGAAKPAKRAKAKGV
jgi:hypothetical protein